MDKLVSFILGAIVWLVFWVVFAKAGPSAPCDGKASVEVRHPEPALALCKKMAAHA